MRRVVAGLMALLIPTAGLAQSPMAPMPYSDFRALAQSFDEAERAGSGGPLTVDLLLERLDAAAGRWAEQITALDAIVPEGCYAAAHAELTAYWTDYAANYTEARPMLASVKSPMGVVAVALMIEGILAEAHPLAYVDDASSLTGRTLDRMHIIDALQSCQP